MRSCAVTLCGSGPSCSCHQLPPGVQVIRPFLVSQVQNRGLKKPILCIVITDGRPHRPLCIPGSRGSV